MTREALRALMVELGRSAPGRGTYRVFLVGGSTAVLMDWRESTVDVDLYADDDAVFRDVQALKERLHVSIEFARPEQFVPPLAGSESRHVFIDKVGRVTFHHYDPYAQLLSKVVRGFARDVRDAFGFISSRMVDPEKFRALVRAIPRAAYAKYPHLSPDAVIAAVDAFLAEVARRDTPR